MLLASFPAGPWQTNCYVVAPAEGSDFVVIDPGVGAAPAVIEQADAAGVGVAGVLLTHGHLDHVASAADLADHYGVPAWIHGAERELLTDAGPLLRDAVPELGVNLREPAQLHEFGDGDEVSVGGLTFRVHHAPGHRPGAVMLSTPLDGDATVDETGATASLLFTGDVLFAGSIGRTDLPGGDSDAMLASLRDVVRALPEDWVVLPGHGPDSTIGAELEHNPYLQPSFLG